MKCFYHKSDLDGHCSGAIIKDKFPECEMIGVDYSDSIADYYVAQGETIFVVDFSFSAREMESLEGHAELVWIDHHKSAIEKMSHLSEIKGLREIGKAGCELTWDYIHGSTSPMAVHLLGRYDVWDHKDENVLPFQYGMRDQENTMPDSEIWPLTFQSLGRVEEIIEHGKIVLAYQDKQNAMYAKGMAYEAEFHGYRAIVMNKPFANSKAFDAVYDPEKHDIMILFGMKPRQLKYSIFCNKPEIDVSEIAVQYGGGGHRGAAGFYSDTPIV